MPADFSINWEDKLLVFKWGNIPPGSDPKLSEIETFMSHCNHDCLSLSSVTDEDDYGYDSGGNDD